MCKRPVTGAFVFLSRVRIVFQAACTGMALRLP
jgi:hypothetical protein